MRNKRWQIRVAAVVAVLFGGLTVFAGGRALFGGAEARAAMGDAVPFVLWFNFLAGFAYVAAGVGLIMERRWAIRLAIAIFAATALVLAAFGLHVLFGGAFEMRTVWAMSLRTLVWAVVAAVAVRCLPRQPETGHGGGN